MHLLAIPMAILASLGYCFHSFCVAMLADTALGSGSRARLFELLDMITASLHYFDVHLINDTCHITDPLQSSVFVGCNRTRDH